jgi:hypothetical protein
MKIIKLTLMIVFLLSNSIFSQSPLLPKYENSSYGEVEGAYYKDINNFHNPFVGTWQYTSGNTSFKIVFRNRTMIHTSSYDNYYFSDFLVGEYQYIENGVEKINTLANLTEEHADSWDYNICSSHLKHRKSYPICHECANDEKRLVFIFNEPSRRHLEGIGYIFTVRRFFENGQEKLKLWFIAVGNGIVVDKNINDLVGINDFTVPFGEYILIKQ